MVLKLNATRDAYQEFYGRNVQQMPKLIADGRVPMNVAQLMQRRLDFRNGSYMDKYFDTGDAVVYHPDGRVKIVLDSQTLRDMTPESPRNNSGALILMSDVYDTLQGEEFERGKLGKIKSPLSREEVKAHPVWKVLARDQGLLNDYADCIFREYQALFVKDAPIDDLMLMDVHPSSVQGNTPDLRAWCVGGLRLRSNAAGGVHLGGDCGRFLGIALDVVSAPGKGAFSQTNYP